VPGAIERVLFLIYSQLKREEREKTSMSTQSATEERMTGSVGVGMGIGMDDG
jgi:hypothetical protein